MKLFSLETSASGGPYSSPIASFSQTMLAISKKLSRGSSDVQRLLHSPGVEAFEMHELTFAKPSGGVAPPSTSSSTGAASSSSSSPSSSPRTARKSRANYKTFVRSSSLLALAAICLLFSMAVDAAPIYPTASGTLVGRNAAYRFRVTEGHFEQYLGSGQWQDFGFVSGINLGATKPGYDPGELPLSKTEYKRLFAYMSSMYFNVVRVYTVLSPAFYEAIAEYNAQSTDPIFVLHGIWTPEEELIGEDKKGSDAFDETISNIMTDNIDRVVTAVHGRGSVRYTYDHVGEYTADISPYILGWLMGTEWYPFMVNKTNAMHEGMAPYQGAVVSARSDARPFESWIAKNLDHLALKSLSYGWMYPLSFVNWVTTDPLSHPSEPKPPISEEDFADVDARYIVINPEYQAGFFLNFHAYTYYPEFMNYLEPRTPVNVWPPGVDQNDPYAQYLLKLREYFPGYALIISEFGLPTSLGNSHFGYKGRNHGSMTEAQQGAFLSDLVVLIKNVNIQGVCVFQLVDEWFKKNWNTLKVDLNRKNWHNQMSSEQFYGLIAAEDKRVVTLDGLAKEWQTTLTQNFLQAPVSGSSLRRVGIHSDSTYLYMMFEKNSNWQLKDELWVAFDTVASQGSIQCDVMDDGTIFDVGTDYLMHFSGAGAVNLYINGYFDLYLRGPGEWIGAIDDASILYDSRRGLYRKWTMVTKNPTDYIMPDNRVVETPAQIFVAGEMIRGTNDFTSPDYNNMATWNFNGSIFEVRLPWAMIGYSDPSTRTVYTLSGKARDLQYNFETSPGVKFQPVLNRVKENAVFYDIPVWKMPCFCERVKKSAITVATTIKAIRGLGDSPIFNLDGMEYEYCECPQSTSSALSNALSYLLLGSILFIAAMLALVGVVRPLTMRVFYCYSYRKQATERGVGALQGLAFILLCAAVVTVYIFSVQKQVSMWQIITDFSDSVNDAQSDSGSNAVFEFVFYIILLNYDALLLIILAIFVRWPAPSAAPAESTMAESAWSKTLPAGGAAQDDAGTGEAKPPSRGRHAFIISCHNSSAKIHNTVVNILKGSEPWQIFVADNGSSEKERVATEDECKALSSQYRKAHPKYRGPNINFGSLTEGSKTVAQFASVFNLRNYPRKIDFVTLIDDDTVVPVNWTEEEVVNYFDRDANVKCLAYPLHARNKVHSLAFFQDLEYLLAGYMKIVQARFGTTLFASGAFNTWRTEYITDILFRHDTMHHGDDLQQGLLLHSLASKPWILDDTKVHGSGYKIDCASTIVVGTDVPICWIHAKDIVPPFLSKWVKPAPCDCGEPSLFLQRGKGWEVSRQRFLWKYLKMIFAYRAINCWTGVWARIVAMYDLALILNDWVLFLYGAAVLIMNGNGLFLVKALLMAWAAQVVVYFLFDRRVLRPAGHSVSPEVKVLFPIIYKLPVLFFIRIYGMLYNIFYYVPFVRNKTKVRVRFTRQNSFRGKIESAFPQASDNLPTPMDMNKLSDTWWTKKLVGEAGESDEEDVDNIAKLLEGESVDAFDLHEHVSQLRRRATNLDRELRSAVLLYAHLRGNKPRSGMMKQLEEQEAEAAAADEAAGVSSMSVSYDRNVAMHKKNDELLDPGSTLSRVSGPAAVVASRSSRFGVLRQLSKSNGNGSSDPGSGSGANGSSANGSSANGSGNGHYTAGGSKKPAGVAKSILTKSVSKSSLGPDASLDTTTSQSSFSPSTSRDEVIAVQMEPLEAIPEGSAKQMTPSTPRSKFGRKSRMQPRPSVTSNASSVAQVALTAQEEQKLSLEKYLADRKAAIELETAQQLSECTTEEQKTAALEQAQEKIAKLERDGLLSLKLIQARGRSTSIQSLYTEDILKTVAKYNEQKDALRAQGVSHRRSRMMDDTASATSTPLSTSTTVHFTSPTAATAIQAPSIPAPAAPAMPVSASKGKAPPSLPGPVPAHRVAPPPPSVPPPATMPGKPQKKSATQLPAADSNDDGSKD